MADPAVGEDTVDYRAQEARKAADRGWVLISLKGKRPVTKNWPLAKPCTPDAAEQMARAGNIGVVTGKPSGIVVIDDDSTVGSVTAGLNLPRTVTARTGSGKRHYYFKNPDEPLGNSASRLGPKIDIRADGGQIVLPGSIHPDTGKPYLWVEGLSPDDVPIAELPSRILKKLTGKAPSAPPLGTNGTVARAISRAERRRAELALDRQARHIRTAADGIRNDTLNTAAFLMGTYIGAGLIDRAGVERELGDAATAVGLGEREIAATLKSGLEAGMREPIDASRHSGLKAAPAAAAAHKNDHNDGNDPPEEAADENNAGRARPEILIAGGLLPEIVDQAEAALLASEGDVYFQRGTVLVRLVRTPTTTIAGGLRRASGAIVFRLIEVPYLVERFMRAANFVRRSQSGDYFPTDCPDRIAKTYLARSGGWNVRPILGVIEAPTLLPDGSLLATPGYHADSQLYFDPGDTRFNPIVNRPTLDDARVALGQLAIILKDFEWEARCDKAAALAAILTALVRRSVPTAPAFAFRAHQRGSGKSLLADVVALLATGRPAAVLSPGKDEDEDRKRILALLLEGDPVACIDNVERPFGNATLCSVLTQTIYKDRILGRSEVVTVPTSVTWTLTGNHLRIEGDLRRRVIPCDLDPKCSRPEEREFDVDLYKHIPEHRGRLVAAALTILKGYAVAGRPSQALPAFGSFEDWSASVRSALVWCGENDPCEGRSRLEESTPEALELRQILKLWRETIGDRRVSAADAIAVAEAGKANGHEELWSAFRTVARGRDEKVDARRLGHWLAKHEQRIEDGMRIERDGERSGVAMWHVVVLGE